MKHILKSCRLLAIPVLMAGLLFAGCDLLDVDNPNNLVEEDLSNPAAAIAMANGAEASVTRAIGQIQKITATASDELFWVGSRDAFQQLDLGNTTNPFNEFTDGAFPFVAEARWLVDNFIDRLEAFRTDGALTSVEALGRTYLYKAIIYTVIADQFDDFAFSDRTEPGPPVGPANMSSLYDEALAALNTTLGLNISDDLRDQALAMRARVHYSKAVWAKVNPVDTANPLVNSPEANADAVAVLANIGGDWVYELVADGGIGLVNDMSDWVNDRREMVPSDVYVQRTEGGNAVEAVTFPDMISGEVHPYLDSYITDWVGSGRYANFPVVSEREMYLIIAEAALASGGDFATPINALRALDGLPEFTGQVDAQALLIESRQANLYLQGRRLIDHYRFASPSPDWLGSSDAVQNPGSFLPITTVEIEANPLIN